MKWGHSLYNLPIFCVPKKQGQGLHVVQDFRELHNHSHIDKYSMKEITESFGEIGRANSTIFSTLNLTSGLWQMQLDEKSQPLTAFTFPGQGQYQWIISPLGLLGCPASFQHLMEGVFRNISNVIVYIDDLDDLLVHTQTHEDRLKILNKFWNVCTHITSKSTWTNDSSATRKDHTFGSREPEGIKPGKAIKDAKTPTDVKTIRSFVGLCNFF